MPSQLPDSRRLARRAYGNALVAALLIPTLCFGQAPPEPTAPPPLVSAPTSPDAPLMDGPEAPTPPPPGSMTPPPGAVVPGYPYSPYGMPYASEQLKPPPEIGLMVSEVLFGMLTAAGATLLPYFLLNQVGFFDNAGDTTISTLLTILIFGTSPLSVAQTEVSLANGSRYYVSESWPAALSGLAAMGLMFGLHEATKNQGNPTPIFLLVGAVVVVPLVEMAVINLTKQPRHKVPRGTFGSLVQVHHDGALSVQAPVPVPLFDRSREGVMTGLQLSLMSGRF